MDKARRGSHDRSNRVLVSSPPHRFLPETKAARCTVGDVFWGAARQKIFATAYLPIIIVAIDHQYYINAVLINTPKYKKCLDSSYGECQRQQHVVPSRLSSPRLLDPTRPPTPPLSSLIHKRRHVVPSYCVRSRTSVTTIIKIRARSRAS